MPPLLEKWGGGGGVGGRGAIAPPPCSYPSVYRGGGGSEDRTVFVYSPVIMYGNYYRQKLVHRSIHQSPI